MQYQSEILRFQEGTQSQHPSPEATIAAAQPGMLAEGGDQIAVLVDLKPRLPYRSRELRSLAVKTYWSSSGSSVARLRRALAAANRHLARFNDKSSPGSKCSGSLTCAVFSGEELFLGQVGASYAFVLHPAQDGAPAESDGFELYPPRDRLLVPLGGAVPPIIHIGYTPMSPESTVLLATTLIAESQSRELWRQCLALPAFDDLTAKIVQEVTAGQVSGTVVSIRALPATAPQPKSRKATRSRRRFITGGTTPERRTRVKGAGGSESDRSSSPETVHDRMPEQSVRPVKLVPKRGTAKRVTESSPVDELVREHRVLLPTAEAETEALTESPPPRRSAGSREMGPEEAVETPAVSHPQAETDVVSEPQPASKPSVPLGERVSAWFQRVKRHRELMRGQREPKTDRTVTAERARLRKALRLVLPGKVEGVSPTTKRKPPRENTSVMGGVALGLMLIVCFISLTKYLQLGGPMKAQELMDEAQTIREDAYETQSLDDWERLLQVSTQIVRLDPQRAEALELKTEAEQAIDALESAAVLSVHPLLELGTSPKPRRILVANDWVYVLNTATDTMLGLRLHEDRVSAPSDTATTVLKRGQTLSGETVDQLVDFAWLEPGGTFPDGAVFIYGEGGIVYIYEPALGPGSVVYQRIEGDLPPGSVTAIETFGNQFYLLHRVANQIFVYEPINGIYESPRQYFSAAEAPAMRLVLDVAIDGRIYLLMGDGSVDAYFAGTTDPSFDIEVLADPDFMPMVMAVESESDEGLVYFGDSRLERIVVVDKRGNLKHQFRLPRGGLRQIEALAVSEEPHVLFFVAENRLYAAKLPDFVD
jgi:hypothetical protein